LPVESKAGFPDTAKQVMEVKRNQMTVKELKELLDAFGDSCEIKIGTNLDDVLDDDITIDDVVASEDGCRINLTVPTVG